MLDCTAIFNSKLYHQEESSQLEQPTQPPKITHFISFEHRATGRSWRGTIWWFSHVNSFRWADIFGDGTSFHINPHFLGNLTELFALVTIEDNTGK